MDKVEILKALAHPTRLYIIETLSGKDGERCVCEIVDELPYAQSTISKHLTILRQAGLVRSRKEGLKVYYETSHPEIKGLLQSLSRLEEQVELARPQLP